MTEFGFINLLVLPAALGLLGFIEPCSIESSLIFIKYLKRKEAARKLAEAILFGRLVGPNALLGRGHPRRSGSVVDLVRPVRRASPT